MTGTAPRDKQRVQRTAGIKIAAALFGIAQGQKNLRHGDFARLQELLVGVREANLTDRRSRLTLLEFQLARAQPEVPPAERDGAGGHQNDLLSPLAHGRATSAAKLSSHARFRRPFSASTSSAEPTLTTTRLASVKRRAAGFAVGNGHGYTILPFT